MKTRILKRKRAFVAAAVRAAGVIGAQLAWNGRLLDRSDDPAKSARLALNPERAARLANAERIRREAHARAGTQPEAGSGRCEAGAETRSPAANGKSFP
jgi:hypothetical protein